MNKLYRTARISPERLRAILAEVECDSRVAGDDFVALCFDLKEAREQHHELASVAFSMAGVCDAIWHELGGCTTESPDDAPPCNDCIACNARLALDHYHHVTK